jgi:hypothetical protein
MHAHHHGNQAADKDDYETLAPTRVGGCLFICVRVFDAKLANTYIKFLTRPQMRHHLRPFSL